VTILSCKCSYGLHNQNVNCSIKTAANLYSSDGKPTLILDAVLLQQENYKNSFGSGILLTQINKLHWCRKQI